MTRIHTLPTVTKQREADVLTSRSSHMGQLEAV